MRNHTYQLGHPRKISARVVAALTITGMLLASSLGIAFAVHDDGLFELDVSGGQGTANTVNDPAVLGEDWAEIYAETSTAFASFFVQDSVGTAETSFFTGGGSKDEELITGGNKHWEWDDGNDVIPDKDDLEFVFAAAYENPADGHTLIYFGADRFATDGSAEVGFWFFREQVTLGPKPTFIGNHQLGDILVLVNFVNGGAIGEMNVFEWVGGTKPLVEIADINAADCANASANDPACGVINNLAGENPPWDYINKAGMPTYETGALFEAGIDLTALLGEDIGCFSSFLAETRSSHSLDAQLKDFALGDFPVCGIQVTKTGDTLSKVSDPVDYTVTIQNTGRLTLHKRNISDTLLGAIATDGSNVDPNGYVLTNTCGAFLTKDDHLPGGTDECTITLRRTVQAGDPDPLPNVVTALYTEESDFTGCEIYDSDDHSVNLFQPAVMIAKTGDELSKAT
ncbi:MAG: hypothetical protein OEV08_16105, partial [Nitrospira sp.]|nr:hypothetical protein [Nitrospira sp.]